MLALKSSSTRNAQRLVRSFATVADTTGYKVAAVDANQPTSSVTFLVKGGSRFEQKAGVAHALKNFAFKGTTKRSALGTIRQSELYGGVLSSSLSREHLALTAEFLRGDEEFFVQLLTEFVESPRFSPYEYAETVAPLVEAESIQASSDPAIAALELAHSLAFRNGLGASLFASAHNSITASDISAFAKTAFSDVAVLGTGIDSSVLSELVKRYSRGPSVATVSSPASTYFGGETRLPAQSSDTIFLGFGTTGASTQDIAALSAHLSPSPSIKWSEGISPISSLIPASTTVKSIYLPYSDATLFGFLVQGKDVKTAGKAVVSALKAAAKGLSKEDFSKAVSKAKFATASALESRDGFVSTLGSKVLAGTDASVASLLKPFEAVTSASISQAAANLVKAKPTFVAVGDLPNLPHADELGL